MTHLRHCVAKIFMDKFLHDELVANADAQNREFAVYVNEIVMGNGRQWWRWLWQPRVCRHC